MDMEYATRPQGLGLRRTFTVKLQEYCFAGGFAAGLEDVDGRGNQEASVDFVPVGEYSALSAKAAERLDRRPRVLPGMVVKEGSSSFLTSVVNVTKSLVGIGMLTLPRALADGTPMLGVPLLLLCGALSALSFFMLGYCAHLTGAESLPQLWDATVGPGSAVLVEVVIFTDTLLSCTAFALLLGNYTSKSLAGLLPSMPPFLRSHGVLVMVVGVGLLLPLCLVRRLSLLRFSSVGGLLCTFYVFLYVVGDFSYSLVASGDYGHDLFEDRNFNIGGLLRSTAIFIVAFMAHFNAPAFYADLKDRSPSRFAALSAASFGAAFIIYMAFSVSGFGRFGDSVPGNALAAYPLTTPVLLMWLGMGLCVVASFPLVFGAQRNAALRIMSRLSGHGLDFEGRARSVSTTVLVLAITCVGAVLEDLSAVVSLCGALSGLCLALVFPGAIMLGVRKRKTAHFKVLARALLCSGTVVGFATTFVVVRRDILGLG